MTEFLGSFGFWHWLAFGVVLAVIEMIAPGVYLLWLGIAAIVTGLALAAFPAMTWEAQLVLFAGLSVVSIFLGRRFFYARETETDHPTLNRRGETYVGQTFTISEATKDGHGRLRIGDSTWAVRVVAPAEDIAAGVRIRIVRVDGSTLLVEPAA